ncbi:MAG: ATP-binding protein [Chloroflexota bacterium]|nr:ATP-binding protein [Chloroflexota bacterium]
MRMMRSIRQLLKVSSTDPDKQRRARLLNILLLGVAVLTLLALSATIVYDITVGVEEPGAAVIYAGSLSLLVGLAITYAINRFGAGWLASSLFVLLLTAVLAFGDEPQEVANGRSLFMLAVPILMASVLLRPYASFIMAGLVGLLITAIGLSVQIVPNAFAMLAFFAIALVSWLSARSLERALEDLRITNRELDQRVEQRTQELAEALGKNQAILEGIADGVIVFDNDGKAVVTNPAITSLLERPADEIIGYDAKTLIGDGVNAKDQASIVGLLRDRETRYPSVKFERGDKTLSMSAAPVRVASETIGTVAVFRDFTREAELDQMKNAFVSMASHELRTPLNAILGYADILQEGVYGSLSDKQRDVVTRVIANTGELLNLATNLLDQAQIEAGTLTLNITSFTLANLIDGAQGVMSVLAQAKGLELISHIASDLPTTLSGDPQRLHQILINLMGNAIKFTKEGTVRVSAYRPDEDHWALEVSDTGCGIPAKAQSHIFEPFQVDGSLTQEHSGAGLGLSIVRQLVTLMGSEITLTSEIGHGSTFTVILPLSPSQEGHP